MIITIVAKSSCKIEDLQFNFNSYLLGTDGIIPRLMADEYNLTSAGS